MFLSATPLAAQPLTDSGDATNLGANLTLVHALTVNVTRGTTTSTTPSTPGGITVNPGGTWAITPIGNINVSN